MNPSQAFASSVSTVILSQVFNGETKINLDLISSNTQASSKISGNVRPNYDTNLKSVSANGLYSKSVSQNVFPRSNALQIARSFDVLNNKLPFSYEYDESITFETTQVNNQSFTLSKEISFSELQQLLNLIFIIDITYNDGTKTSVTSYDKDLYVPNGYYGEEIGNNVLYESTSDLVRIEGIRQSSDIQISDGNPGGGLTLSAYTPLLQQAIQSEKYIGGIVTIRVAFVKDGHILIGPLRGGKFKIDGASQSFNPKNEEGNIINIGLIKTWENINQVSGIKTAESYFKSRIPTDGFFRNASNAAYSKTFKE